MQHGRGIALNSFSAVSDETRRTILDLLIKKPLTVGQINRHFSSLTQPGISKHLAVLRKARLVKVSVSAQNRVYSLDKEGFLELEKWISKYQEFWKSNLDSLVKYLDRNSKSERKVIQK